MKRLSLRRGALLLGCLCMSISERNRCLFTWLGSGGLEPLIDSLVLLLSVCSWTWT